MAVSIQLKCFLSHLNLTYLLVSRPFYHDHLFGIFSSGGSRGGPGRPAPHPPLNLRPNGGPKSRKKFFRDRPPPPPPHILSQGLDDYPPLTYLTVRMRQRGNAISRLTSYSQAGSFTFWNFMLSELLLIVSFFTLCAVGNIRCYC